MKRKRTKKAAKVVKRQLRHAHEVAADRERSQRERAEREAAYLRAYPFRLPMEALYGPEAVYLCDLVVAVAAGLPGALEALREIDAALVPEHLSPEEGRRVAMAAWFTDPRVEPDSGFCFDEFAQEDARQHLLDALPDAVAAEVRALQPDHGWMIAVERSGDVFITR